MQCFSLETPICPHDINNKETPSLNGVSLASSIFSKWNGGLFANPIHTLLNIPEPACLLVHMNPLHQGAFFLCHYCGIIEVALVRNPAYFEI